MIGAALGYRTPTSNSDDTDRLRFRSQSKMNRSLCRLIVSGPKWASALPRRSVAHFTFVKDQPDPSLGSMPVLLIEQGRRKFSSSFRSNEGNESLSDDSECVGHHSRQRSHGESVRKTCLHLPNFVFFFSCFRRRCRVRRRFSLYRGVETEIR